MKAKIALALGICILFVQDTKSGVPIPSQNFIYGLFLSPFITGATVYAATYAAWHPDAQWIRDNALSLRLAHIKYSGIMGAYLNDKIEKNPILFGGGGIILGSSIIAYNLYQDLLKKRFLDARRQEPIKK